MPDSQPEKPDSSLPLALVRAMKDKNLQDVASELADAAIDGSWNGFPVTGALLGAIRGVRNIVDWLNVRKIQKFLEAVGEADQARRELFVADLKREGKETQFGETAMMLLALADDLDKATIIGNLFCAAVKGHIALARARHLAAKVNRAYMSELRVLSRISEHGGVAQDVQESLYLCGLLHQSVMTLGDGASSPTFATYYLNQDSSDLLQYGGIPGDDFNS